MHQTRQLQMDHQQILSILKTFGTLKNKRILELGCGIEENPLLLALLREEGAIITGIDQDAQEHNEDRFMIIRKNVSNVVLEESFDIILSNWFYGVLTTAEKEQVMRICEKHLTQDGIAIHVTTPRYFSGKSSILLVEKHDEFVLLKRKA